MIPQWLFFYLPPKWPLLILWKLKLILVWPEWPLIQIKNYRSFWTTVFFVLGHGYFWWQISDFDKKDAVTLNCHQHDFVNQIAVASKSKKVAAGFLLLSGFMILWITSIFAAQIKYEFYFDQTYGQLIGAQVKKFKNWLWNSKIFSRQN